MRWFVYNRSYAIVLIIIHIYCIYKVSGNAAFELQISKFLNHNGKDFDGKCCQGYLSSSGKCSEKCLTKFRVCLNVYQEVINIQSPCTFGEVNTPVLGANNIDNIKPLKFTLDSWQGTFSLIIEAWHEDENNTYFTEPVLISRLKVQKWLKVDNNWTQDVYVTDHTQLNYQYRVVCQDFYHGEGCRKWCRPRNDTFGHYTCNEQGDRICLDGWHGSESYCNSAVCSPGCKGTCKLPNQCDCPIGWKGEKCDECEVYPGCLHGTCNKPWECDCHEGWGGLFCNQDLNYCTNHHPCKNGATCFNTAPGAYSCKCLPGFNGTNCEILNDSCSNDPCTNGGTCLDTGNKGFVCQCRSGYTGRYCELSGQTCSDRPCRNGAPCTDTPVGFQCHCRDGYEGSTCEQSVNDCISSPCDNGGSCVDEHRGFRCVCPVGYSGLKCEVNVDDCSHAPCLNGGHCIDGIDSFKCRCQPGFLGELCQINVNDCVTLPCANGGSCIDGINDFQCHCLPGWRGKYCTEKIPISESPCSTNPCENGGTCRYAPELSTQYRCHCLLGFIGPRCTVLFSHHAPSVDAPLSDVPMSPTQIVLIVVFSVAVPALAIISFVILICMKRKRRREQYYHDEEVRRQNEFNTLHNAVNNKNLARGMIFNSLDYPHKPINTDTPTSFQSYHQNSKEELESVHMKKYSSVDNTYSIVPARSTKTLNTDVSRQSLASRLEKELDSYSPFSDIPSEYSHFTSSPSKVPQSSLHRVQSHSSDVHVKNINNHNNSVSSTPVPSSLSTPPEVCSSPSNTPTSECATPSSVFIIDDHVMDEKYIATEV